VNKLHASAEGTTEDWRDPCRCFFHRAFFGKLQSKLSCNQCGSASRTEDPIMDLSLAFQVQRKKSALGAADRGKDALPSLEGCLASYTAEEQLAASDYTCNECSAKGATKQLKLKELPVILCMQLKVSSHPTS
jgi:ubiquitin carboxyl-terminal hydrolase 22/27/51